MIDIKSLQERIHAEAGPLGIDKCCLQLVELLINAPNDSPIFNHNHLQQEIQGCSLEDIQKSINYLKASPLKLFSQAYFYLDDDCVIYQISEESLAAALLDGALPHPDNSRLDPNFKSKVFIAYIGNKSGIAL